MHKLYSFTKLGNGILIPSNIPPSSDGFLEPDLSLYLTRCSQPIKDCLYPCSECIGWSDLTELQNGQHDHLLAQMHIFLS